MSDGAARPSSRSNIIRMAGDVVAAYLSKNQIQAGKLPELINSVFNSLNDVDGPGTELSAGGVRPAISAKRSVTPDYIICLEDGKKMKVLKRHLRTTYNLTPEQYRAKWSLPPDYPMVAPNYAAHLSQFAKQIGLGRKPSRANAAAAKQGAATPPT